MRIIVCCKKNHNFHHKVRSQQLIECINCYALISTYPKGIIENIYKSPRPKLIDITLNPYSTLLQFEYSKHLYKYTIKINPDWALKQLKK